MVRTFSSSRKVALTPRFEGVPPVINATYSLNNGKIALVLGLSEELLLFLGAIEARYVDLVILEELRELVLNVFTHLILK